jgi:FkbM family methyltransferase
VAHDVDGVGLESRLRDWAFSSGLGSSTLVVRAYRGFCRVRFAGRWDRPVAFRGGRFIIGKDLSLYPAVHSAAFEREEFDFLLPRVDRDSVVWDVGANVGLHAVLLSKRANLGRVIAFEPVPSTAAQLRENLELNDSHNVSVEEVALSDNSGTGTMRIFHDAPGCNHLMADGEQVSGPTRSVRVETADQFWRASGALPDVIKVDVEGFEPAFVRGARQVLTERRPLILMEVNTSTFNQDPSRRAEWEQMLAFLFSLYGSAIWFGLNGPRTVTQMPMEEALSLPRAATIAFGGEIPPV